MSFDIFYFSGTGNSLKIASDISKDLNAKQTSIASALKQYRICSEADSIGIVFPVYFGAILEGIPLIVRRFIDRLENIESKYIFVLSTYGLSGPDYKELENLISIRGGKLAAVFGVKMPFYYLAINGFGKAGMKQKKNFLRNWEVRKKSIVKVIREKKKTKIKSKGFIVKQILVPFGRKYYLRVMKKLVESDLPLEQLLQWFDTSFRTDQNCKGCGTCAGVCPVGNIDIVHDKPKWRHRCEQCCACVSRCPEKAILYNGKKVNLELGEFL